MTISDACQPLMKGIKGSGASYDVQVGTSCTSQTRDAHRQLTCINLSLSRIKDTFRGALVYTLTTPDQYVGANRIREWLTGDRTRNAGFLRLFLCCECDIHDRVTRLSSHDSRLTAPLFHGGCGRAVRDGNIGTHLPRPQLSTVDSYCSLENQSVVIISQLMIRSSPLIQQSRTRSRHLSEQWHFVLPTGRRFVIL